MSALPIDGESRIHGRIDQRTASFIESPTITEVYRYATTWENFIFDDPFQQKRAKEASVGTFAIDPLTQNICLPNAYPVPNRGYYNTQFYWDSVAMVDGMLATDQKKYLPLSQGVIDNMQYLFDRLRIIPNEANTSFTDRSQPPLLTSLIMQVFHAMEEEEPQVARQWLAEKIAFAKEEYATWTQPDRIGTRRYNHKVEEATTFSTWGNADVPFAVHANFGESGLDTTDEFGGNPHNTYSVMLQSFLGLYEKHFAEAARLLGNEEEAADWDGKLRARMAEMDEKLWDEEKGFYFNWDRHKKERIDYWSLTGFLPMFAGLVSEEKARRMAEHLPKFAGPFGIAMTTEASIQPKLNGDALAQQGIIRRHMHDAIDETFRERQWTYPSDWANMKEMLCTGLEQYNMGDIALGIRIQSLETYGRFFANHGTLPERINVLTGENGNPDHYQPQTGFGWTNAHVVKSYLAVARAELAEAA